MAAKNGSHFSFLEYHTFFLFVFKCCNVSSNYSFLKVIIGSLSGMLELKIAKKYEILFK